MADIRHLLDKIRKAIYGKEVRGSLADGLEAVNNEVEDATEVAVNVEQRQDAVEQQFNTLLGEWSDDKPIDNAETIAARTNTKESKTYENLGKRLDEEYGKVTAQLADTDSKLSLTDWELQSKQRQAQPLVVIYSDDGRTDDNDLLDIAKNNNVPFCLSVIPERIVENNPNHYSVEQLKDFRDNYGFEILVHGYSHKRLGDMPYEEQEYEMKTAKEVMAGWGFEVQGITYPFRSRTDDTVYLARKYFRYAASGGTGQNDLPLGQHFLLTQSLETTTFNQLKGMVDEAKDKGQLLILGAHGYELDNSQLQMVDDIVKYIKQSDIPIVTFSEALNRVGNVLEVGTYGESNAYRGSPHTVIGADGSIDSLDILTHLVDHEAIEVNVVEDLITGYRPFKRFKSNVMRVINPNGDIFPESRSGRLIVDKVINNSEYIYCLYIPNIVDGEHERIYMARFNTDANKFKKWQRLNYIAEEDSLFIKLEEDSVTSKSSLTDFPRGKKSYCEITPQNSDRSDFPDGSTGNLYTYRLAGTVARHYQEFVRTESFRKYIRYWNPIDHKWNDWRLFNTLAVE